MTWKNLCRPKSKGGMGFRSLVDFNRALLAKQVWRIIRHPNTLVAKVLKAKYFPDEDIMTARLKSNCSFSWRSIMWGRDLLRKGLLWKIGDGHSVRVFEDPWLPALPNGSTLRRLGGLEDVRVAALMTVDGEWDMQSCHSLLLPIEIEEVKKLEKFDSNIKDTRYWSFDQRGDYIYTVKTGYLVASGYYDVHEASSSEEDTKWWKYLWSLNLPQRIKIFAWRAFKNIIPTELNLHRHHVPVFGRCGWCRKGWGSTTHVLMYCEKVRSLWSDMEFWDTLKKWEDFELGAIGGAMKKAGQSRESFEIWIVGLWLVWKVLCAEKHKSEVKSWRDLRVECCNYIENYRAARSQAANAERLLPREGSLRWTRPRKGRFRLDVDYAVDESRGRVGAIVRDHEGNIIVAMAKTVAASSSILHGEIKGMMHGICLCIEEELSPVEVFTDSMLVVLAVSEENEEDSVLYTDLFEFFNMVKGLNVFSIEHTRREANKAAHELAHVAINLETTQVWHENWPEWLSNIVVDDIQ